MTVLQYHKVGLDSAAWNISISPPVPSFAWFNSRSRHLSLFVSTCLLPIGVQNTRSLSCRITLQQQNTHDEALFKLKPFSTKHCPFRNTCRKKRGKPRATTGSPQVKKGGPNCLHHHCMATPHVLASTRIRWHHTPPRAHQLAKAHQGHAAIPKVARMAGKRKGQMTAGPQNLVRMWSAGTGWICAYIS